MGSGAVVYILRFIKIGSGIRELGKSSLAFRMLSGVPQGSTSVTMLLNICVNNLFAKIHFPEFLLFTDDLKIFCLINSAENCKLL
jgi:hypothetical protein